MEQRGMPWSHLLGGKHFRNRETHHDLVGGNYTYPSEKYEFVSWDGMMKFPAEWTNNPFMFQTTNQMMFDLELS